MKTSTQLFLHTVHGIFLGFILGLTLAVLANEFYPELESYFQPGYILFTLAALGGILGFIKGYNQYGRLFDFLFSTIGTIIVPVISFTVIFYLLGLDRTLSLLPILFKRGIGLGQMDTQLSTYLLSIFLTLSAVAAFISSFSINKKKRWTW